MVRRDEQGLRRDEGVARRYELVALPLLFSCLILTNINLCDEGDVHHDEVVATVQKL